MKYLESMGWRVVQAVILITGAELQAKSHYKRIYIPSLHNFKLNLVKK